MVEIPVMNTSITISTPSTMTDPISLCAARDGTEAMASVFQSCEGTPDRRVCARLVRNGKPLDCRESKLKRTATKLNGCNQPPRNEKGRKKINMNSKHLPTMSVPRMHRLTVADVMEALKNAPSDAVIQCKSGGYLEAGVFSAYKESEATKTRSGRPAVKTCWE